MPGTNTGEIHQLELRVAKLEGIPADVADLRKRLDDVADKQQQILVEQARLKAKASGSIKLPALTSLAGGGGVYGIIEVLNRVFGGGASG